MNIVIANDHTSVDLKNVIIRHLNNTDNINITDLGTSDDKRSDYPDYAVLALSNWDSAGYKFAVLICGTGAGMCISANKIKGIRAVVCSEPYTAMMSRAHNDANVLCMGSRVVGLELAKLITDSFLETSFEGGRHLDRVKKIMQIEK
jgi:ribose 5-phosphate isomerase B